MTKEEIKKIVEEQIAYHCDEFDLTREDVVEPVFYGMLDMYIKDEIDLDDLEEAGKLLNVGIIKSELIKYKELKNNGK